MSCRPYSSEQVFLSHSGRQKNFGEQLHIDLKRANVCSFFDKYSLLQGEEFPHRIFEAAKNCRVAIVVLSENYITSKWPMQELCAFVEAQKTTNSNLKIFPLFYKMSPDQLCQEIHSIEIRGLCEYWENIGNSSKRPIDFEVWLEALKALRSFNGRVYDKYGGKVDYRSKLVTDIRRLLPRTIKYEDPSIKGKERLCEIVAKLFEKAPHSIDRVKFIGLYGARGSGKATMCKSLCDFYFDTFAGRVFHAKFLEEGLPIKTLRLLVMILADVEEESTKFVNSYDQALRLLNQRMDSTGGIHQRVFLALDNIPDRTKSICEVQGFLTAGFGEGSLILLTARSAEILNRVIPQNENCSFTPLPNLTEEEAIDVLLIPRSLETGNLNTEQKQISRECVELCCEQGNYHPSALKTFGTYLCEKFTCNLSHRLQIPENLFKTFNTRNEKICFDGTYRKICFDGFHPEYLRIFILLTFYMSNLKFVKNFDYFGVVAKWLANTCSDEDGPSMCRAIERLKSYGLIKSWRPDSSSFRELRLEFGEKKLKQMMKWMSSKTEDEIPILTEFMIEAIKFKNCRLIRDMSLDQFSNVSVVHLESMPNLGTLKFGSMGALRSITLVDCNSVEVIQGLHNCSSLEIIYLYGNCRVKVPKSTHFRNLREITLKGWNDVIEPLDLTDCRDLQNIELTNYYNSVTGLLCLNFWSFQRELNLLNNNDSITEVVGLDEHQSRMITGSKISSI